MPLIKHVPALPQEKITANPQAVEINLPDVLGTPLPPAKEAPAKAAYTGRKAAASKDEYWANREERDIEKDKHIRLSGVLQALLGSVNFGQYCTGTTAEDYLTKAEQAALRLAKFVTENAK